MRTGWVFTAPFLNLAVVTSCFPFQGEGTADPVWMVMGAWIVYAQKFGALCLQLEHRFYGKSHPTQ